MATFTQAFAQFGATLKNPRGVWSAQHDRTDEICVTMWDDRLHDGIYRLIIPEREWRNSGWRGLVKHVKYALAHSNGEVSVILIRAESVVAKRRNVDKKSCKLLSNKWKITHFDEAKGELTMIPL
jgi:hypothetical protein